MSTKYIVKKPFGGLKSGDPVFPPSGLVAQLIKEGYIEEGIEKPVKETSISEEAIEEGIEKPKGKGGKKKEVVDDIKVIKAE